MPKRMGILFLGVFTLLVMTFGCASMQEKPVNASLEFPSKPLTLIVPTTAGGGWDIIARSIAKNSERYLGQNMVVANKPGGGGIAGYNELAGSLPDGYTIGYVGQTVIMQTLYGETKYDYPTALEPLALINSASKIAVVRADAPWGNLQELIDYAKQNPGKIKFGHGGLGSNTHVVGEMFAQEAGIQIEQVPFQGPAEAITALLGGHIQLFFAGGLEIKEHIKAGKVRALAVTDTKRLTRPEFVNVPTFREQGVNVVFTVWQSIAVPKGLPPQVKNKLAAGIKAIIDDPEFIKMGMNIEYLGPQEAAQRWLDDKERLTKLIKETGLAERIAAQKK